MDLDTFCAQVVPLTHPEPTTHPEARPLVEAVAVCLGSAQVCALAHMVVLQAWGASLPHQAGISIHWQGRVVLLATDTGDVWLYHPGAWEVVLRERAKVAPSARQVPPPQGPLLRSAPGLESGQAKAFLVDESAATFRRRLAPARLPPPS